MRKIILGILVLVLTIGCMTGCMVRLDDEPENRWDEKSQISEVSRITEVSKPEVSQGEKEPKQGPKSALLTEIDPIQKNRVAINIGGGWTFSSDVDTNLYNQDTNKKKYYSTLQPDEENDCYVVYYINYEYDRLTGTVYRPYPSLGGNGDSGYIDGFVKIYGDGNLLYSSPAITQNTYETTTFNIDVSSVRELRVELSGAWYPGSGHIATVGLADATLIREDK